MWLDEAFMVALAAAAPPRQLCNCCARSMRLRSLPIVRWAATTEPLWKSNVLAKQSVQPLAVLHPLRMSAMPYASSLSTVLCAIAMMACCLCKPSQLCSHTPSVPNGVIMLTTKRFTANRSKALAPEYSLLTSLALDLYVMITGRSANTH